MTSKSLLTATMLVFATIAFGQAQQQPGNTFFNTSKPSAKERGLKAMEEQHDFKFREKSIPANQKSQAKSASNFSARLDSLVSDLGMGYKMDWVFDEHGNNTLELQSFWGAEETWNPEQQTITTFNAENLPVEKIQWYWSFSEMELQQSFRETFTYQENDLLVETTGYDRVSDEWIPSTKVVNEYDDQENLSSTTSLSWNPDIEIFFPITRQDFSYNETGGLLELKYSIRQANEWINNFRELYTLNEDNNPVSVVGSEWNAMDETWETVSLDEYTYNAAGSETEVIYSFWNEIEEEFEPIAKNEMTYNDLNKLLSVEFSFWNQGEAGWQGFFLDTYEYDDAGNIDVYIFYGWDEDMQDLLPEGRSALTYNNDYPVSDIMLPEFIMADGIDHMPLSVMYEYFESGEWIEDGNENLYYTLFDVTSVKDVNDGPFSVFPNPFRETIGFSGAEPLQRFTLYDLQGRVVMQKQLDGAMEVNTGQVPAGIYVYQIEGTNARQVGKLVRE